ncbi:AAA family ATPase [Gemmiger sp.]|uniref:AAA family ATPase n=1 Tax=Gemmiger sp. TaxID=2049027 RepID=UPI0025C17550|nr:AAA family ATPase [Gemmiger sp.]
MNYEKLPKTISAEELLSTPLPPVKWIIPDLLPAGLALFAGPSKAGKSWLTLWLCLQIAQGNPVWNREIEPRTVIYFSLEDTFNRLQSRIFQLIDGGDAPERLILQTECPSIGQGLEEQVEALVHTYHDVGLIVIDTLQKVRLSDGNGGMYANDYKEAGALKKIADKYGICILLIQNEPILYRAYYTLAITTGLRRGELCALQWRDIAGACELTVRRSRSCASGKIVESDTKSHRERIVTIPLGIWELLMALRQQQVLHSGVPDREQPIFTDPDGHVPHPDTFTRHLRKLYKKCGLPEEYHLHTLRHFYATYLLQEGTSKQVAASLLGHADTAFLERTYCHPQDVAKQQAANLMQDLLNNQNPCYVAFMKNKNRKAKKAG